MGRARSKTKSARIRQEECARCCSKSDRTALISDVADSFARVCTNKSAQTSRGSFAGAITKEGTLSKTSQNIAEKRQQAIKPSRDSASPLPSKALLSTPEWRSPHPLLPPIPIPIPIPVPIPLSPWSFQRSQSESHSRVPSPQKTPKQQPHAE